MSEPVEYGETRDLTDDDLHRLRTATEVVIESGWDDDDFGLVDPITILGMVNEIIASRADRDSLLIRVERAEEFTRSRAAEIARSCREGNMMLDNEPVLFVKGYETAVSDIADALINARPRHPENTNG
jgi:hypothetical protein